MGVGLSGYGTRSSHGAAGADGPRGGEIWLDAPGICNLTSVLCESLSEGRRRCLRVSPLPL